MACEDDNVEIDDASYTEPRRRATDRWHVGREIPLALIIMLMLQTAGGVWWAANLSSKVDAAIVTLEEFKRERYTKEDARKDREFFQLVFENEQRKDADFARRLETLERQHEWFVSPQNQQLRRNNK